MTAQAKENARLCGLSEAPIRYIVDDCSKFVEREIRRGNRYDGIIMDPPSYGRGPGGEVWKLEDCVSGLVGQAEKLLSDNALFFLLNTYTTGLSPMTMRYIADLSIKPRHGGHTEAGELWIAASVRRQCPLGSLTGRKGEQPDGKPETGKRRAFY
jgi:23S rRNA (cytosine1962-C5)-methyltransferase